MSYIIAIDGPAATGKSTVAKVISEKLGYVYVDTGAMYRALTLKAINHNVDVNDEDALIAILNDTTIELTVDRKVLLDGNDVTNDVRIPEVTNNVSFVAKHSKVREVMVDLQRKMASGVNVVMDGRDIGTVVFPDANLKIYMHASSEERGIRRYRENIERGINTPLDVLIEEINNRDYEDSNREVAPLRQAEDAIYLDTTNMTIDEVVNFVISKVSE